MKPKFKVGDFIIDRDDLDILQIIEVDLENEDYRYIQHKNEDNFTIGLANNIDFYFIQEYYDIMTLEEKALYL
jgi:hypothetical protein